MAAFFNVSGDLLSRSDTAIGSATAHTLACRVYKTTSSDNGMAEIFFGSTWVTFFSTFSGNIHMAVNDNVSDFGITPFAYSTNTWYHLAITADGTNVRCYVNGVLQSTTAKTLTGMGASVSWDVGQQKLNAQDFVIYNAALSDAEIAGLYAKRQPTRRTNLIAHYPLFPGTGRTADYSGAAKSLTATGSPADGTADAPVGWGAPIGPAFKAQVSAVALVGADTTNSAGSATIAVAQALVGADTTASAADAAVKIARALVGADTTNSAADGGIKVAQALVGADTTASAATAGLSLAIPEVGANTTNSAAAATIGVARALVGANVTNSAAAAGMLVAQADTGNSDAASSATAPVLVARALVGADTTASAANAGMSNVVALAGASGTTASAATGALTVLQALVGATATASSANAAMSSDQLAGANTTASAADGAFKVARAEVGSSPSASAADAPLSVAKALVGAAAPTASTATTGIGVQRDHVGSSVAASAATAGLSVAVGLAGTSGTGAGAGVVSYNVVGVSGTATFASAALRLTLGLGAGVANSQSAATARLTISRPAGVSTFRGVLHRCHAPRTTGDTRPFEISVIDYDTGDPLDLGGNTATFKLVSADLTTIVVDEAPCSIDRDLISFRPSQDDVAIVGDYIGRFSIEISEGQLRVFHILFEVTSDI